MTVRTRRTRRDSAAVVVEMVAAPAIRSSARAVLGRVAMACGAVPVRS